MKKILVIGGSGFVGRPFVSKLLSKGYLVTLLNRGNRPIEGTEQIIADRNSFEELTVIKKKIGSDRKFDTIVDISAYTLEQSQNVWELFSENTNYWIHLSSASVYKEAKNPPSETYPIGGADVWGDYGIQKSEIDAYYQSVKTKVPVIILRPPYLYGPGNDSDREQFIWSRALNNLPIFIPGDGKTIIQFLHVYDLASAFLYFIQNPPEQARTYNIATKEVITQNDWCKLLLKCSELSTDLKVLDNLGSNFRPREYFPFRNYPCALNLDSIDELSWKPEFDLYNGFKQTFNSYNSELLKKGLKYNPAEKELTKLVYEG